MRIQHNITAMNSYRNFANNNSQLGKNLEKLSSGYKINRAGDDAAGLAISQKMRAQIQGLEGAQKNAKDGISLVQTAEGALQEVHDMLNRMYSLAEQSANGTYDKTMDRVQLQKEVDSLRDEINRIASSANYNGVNLLDGNIQSGTTVYSTEVTGVGKDGEFFTAVDISGACIKGSGGVIGGKQDEKLGTMECKMAKLDTKGEWTTKSVTTDNKMGMQIKLQCNNAAKTGVTGTYYGYITTNKKSGDTITLYKDADLNDKLRTDQQGASKGIGTGGYAIRLTIGKDITVTATTGVKFGSDEAKKNTPIQNKEIKFGKDYKVNTTMQKGVNLSLQVGDTGQSFNQLTVAVKDMHATRMGVGGIDISTQRGAQFALNRIKTAINYVSDTRGDLGALQNRLDHTINNLSVMQENIQNAESVIRDTDMADEMMKYTKNNILNQSAQAMLAQANQLPQGILQLLQ